MDSTKNMVLIKGEIKTSDIVSCQYNTDTKKMEVTFCNGKTYPYASANVEWLKEPRNLKPEIYRISREGKVFFDIAAIYEFEGMQDTYWHICFKDGRGRDYCKSDLHIVESCLDQRQAVDVFQYIKQIAELSNLKNEETGEKMLAKKFEKVTFVDKTLALARYLNPSSVQTDQERDECIPIFPFGCNNSQYKAEYAAEANADMENKTFKKNLAAKSWMAMWQECQMLSEEKGKIGFLFQVKSFLKYGITDLSFYKQDAAKIITIFQAMYYHTRQTELVKEMEDIEKYLQCINKDLLNDLCSQSMVVLKDKLAGRYGGRKKRRIFSEDDLWKNANDVLEEYPVILSTTFSSRSSLHTDVVYDYLIMDEASQVDIATGALALSCAKNVVIVGDTKQLPNVVTEDVRDKAKEIFDRFHIDGGYQFTKSFLQSVLDVMPNVTQALLREHYRCHPKIIDFCNQKFYRGELIIMTSDEGEENVLSVVKTVPGNHARNHYSQRQIDVIKHEIIPKYVSVPEETGIIAPYKNQIEALENEIKDIDAATVHKFQGKEKETIIISTVDDEISDFADDPYLINVAVSRAKKKLVLVVTGNEQVKERNITDLIDYIQYHNFEVADSKIYSIFDYLYKQYTEERKVFLQKHKRISEYDSENLMYSLLEEIISENQYSSLDVVCHFPINMLIRNTDLLNEQECHYVMNPATHIDFLIYNRIGKKPVLAIEVDGYEYHKKETLQASRDLLKDSILERYHIPLLRFKTNGSGEKEKIKEMLNHMIAS